MSWAGPFQSEQEFLAAYKGELGDEAEHLADELVDDGTVELEDGDAVPQEGNLPQIGGEQWVAGMEAQLARLDQKLGRRLTRKEVAGIVKDTEAFGHIPDLWEEHGEKLQDREKDSDANKALMVEEFQDEKARAEEAENGMGGVE